MTPQSKKTQEKRIADVFIGGIFTMKQASVKTEIDRSNICRFIAKWKKSNTIYKVRTGICPITKDRAGFYTMNYNLYLTQKGCSNGK